MRMIGKALGRNLVRWAVILMVMGVPVFGYLPATPPVAPRPATPAVGALSPGCAAIAPAPGLDFDCK